MRSSLVWVVAMAAGCFGPASQIDAKSSVTLNGIVQTHNNSAVANDKVKLIRHPDPLQALGQLFVVIGSVGLACINGQADICSSFEESQSGSNGSYQFAMRGAETQGSTGEALPFTVFAGCPGGNCAVASDFLIQRTQLTIPTLKLWTDVGTLVDVGGNPQFGWPAIESSVGGSAADDYRVSISAGDGTTIWLQDAQRATTTTVDPRVTQDLSGNWSVVAQRKQPRTGTDFTFDWYSSQQAYPNHNFIPLSRAADCFTQGANGMPSMLARPCPVTDGNPATKFQPVSAPTCPMGQTCPVNNWILIDLGFAHPLALLVLYDVSVSNSTAQLIVETSDDLMTWTRQATLQSTQYQTTPLSGANRFLRLRLSDPNAQFYGGGNGEIAVYAPF
jgi:hypothetical protein